MDATQETLGLKTVSNSWTIISHSPEWVIIGLALMVVAFLVQKSRKIDNFWIPVIYVFGGTILYPLLCDKSVVPPTQRNPWLLIILLGLILGFGSFVLHYAAYRFLGKYLPVGFMPDDGVMSAEKKDNTKTE